MEASSALGSVFDNKLYTTILERGFLQRRVLHDDDCQSLFAVLRIWSNLEWPQLECFIGYVTSDPEWALQRGVLECECLLQYMWWTWVPLVQ